MTRILISFVPFAVCLLWFILFLLGHRCHDRAKRVVTWFLLTCTVLYFCHGLFFTTGLSYPMECLWTLCSLSVYPIYYLYIRTLTAGTTGGWRCSLVLAPGAAYFVLMLFFKGGIDIVRIVLSSA